MYVSILVVVSNLHLIVVLLTVYYVSTIQPITHIYKYVQCVNLDIVTNYQHVYNKYAVLHIASYVHHGSSNLIYVFNVSKDII